MLSQGSIEQDYPSNNIKRFSFRGEFQHWTSQKQKQPPEVFYKKGVLINFTKFTGKQLCQGLFLNKNAGLRPATLFKKRPWHRCFPVNFVKILRTPFLQNTSWRLLLSCEWVRGVDIKDVINKFEISNFWKEIKLQLITNKHFSIVFPICCLLIVLSWIIHC